MNIRDVIAILDQQVPNPETGLPDDLFYFVSRMTPLVNVDLLIKDELGRTLLSWRNDQYCGKGWHIPGGIVRFKEKFETRIKKVAVFELGSNVSFDPTPLAMNQIIHQKARNRSHFISFLYKCFLPPDFVLQNKKLAEKNQGFLAWHESCPKDLIKYHEMYRKYINNNF